MRRIAAWCAVALVAAIVGCTRRCEGPERSSSSVLVSPANRSSGTSHSGASVLQAPPATNSASVPIVYNFRFEHPQLTSDQVERILAWAAPSCPPGQRVWFIYATANWPDEEGRSAMACVYFTPQRQTGRVREGRHAWYDEGRARLVEKFRDSGLFDEENDGPAWLKLPEYCQVSDPHRPFTDALEIPDLKLMPFDQPDGLSEEELVALVDFVRTGPGLPVEWMDRDGREFIRVGPARFDSAAPIWKIRREGDVFRVRNGAVQAILAGRGQFLECRRMPDGTFEVLSLGMWDA